jgi:hypothetical protein
MSPHSSPEPPAHQTQHSLSARWQRSCCLIQLLIAGWLANRAQQATAQPVEHTACGPPQPSMQAESGARTGACGTWGYVWAVQMLQQHRTSRPLRAHNTVQCKGSFWEVAMHACTAGWPHVESSRPQAPISPKHTIPVEPQGPRPLLTSLRQLHRPLITCRCLSTLDDMQAWQQRISIRAKHALAMQRAVHQA